MNLNYGDTSLVSALKWVEQTMLGSVATGFAILAVAVIGFHALQGKLNWQQGGRVVLGCFLIFGAPIIAAGISGRLDSSSRITSISAAEDVDVLPPPVRANEQFDPYAGASVQQRW